MLFLTACAVNTIFCAATRRRRVGDVPPCTPTSVHSSQYQIRCVSRALTPLSLRDVSPLPEGEGKTNVAFNLLTGLFIRAIHRMALIPGSPRVWERCLPSPVLFSVHALVQRYNALHGVVPSPRQHRAGGECFGLSRRPGAVIFRSTQMRRSCIKSSMGMNS